MTLDEFFEKLPRDGWTLYRGVEIVREAAQSCCPALYVDGLGQADRWRVYTAADNNTKSDLFDPALRARLLAHCGLTEVKP